MAPPAASVTAFAPGRVNLIGDHTDYTGGRCLPMAIGMGVTVRGQRVGERVVLRSRTMSGDAVVPLEVDHPDRAEPTWARYVAGVVAEIRPATGFAGLVASDLPAGAGLSSSAALEVATALALGFEGPPVELARRCQAAEHRASGVPCGILDQLASAGGVEGHALVMNCTTLDLKPVPVAEGIELVVVHSEVERALAGSAYADRRAECEKAEAVLGPLTEASVVDADHVPDRVIGRRARHVITENNRVIDAAIALSAGHLDDLGELFVASHRSLRDDFECSTPEVDDLVERLGRQPGVHGARMTGGGWGGCVVAVTEPGAVDVAAFDRAWVVRAGPGARVSTS